MGFNPVAAHPRVIGALLWGADSVRGNYFNYAVPYINLLRINPTAISPENQRDLIWVLLEIC